MPSHPAAYGYSRGGTILLYGNEYGTASSKGAVRIEAGAGDGSSNKGKIYFKTGDANEVIIDEGGNVGIGTDSPDSKLHIKQSGAGTGDGLRIESSAYTDRCLGVWSTTSQGLTATNDLYLRSGSGSGIGGGTDSGMGSDVVEDGASADQSVLVEGKVIKREPNRVGSKVMESKLIRKVDPIYPETARQAQLLGTRSRLPCAWRTATRQ